MVDPGDGFADKLRLIRAHPCLPILKCLFNKCERATDPRNWSDVGLFGMGEVGDLVERAKGNSASGVPDSSGASTSCGDAQVDELVFHACLVLRTQLAELHRLSELCEQFTHKYRERLANTFAALKLAAPEEEGERQSEKRRAKRTTPEKMAAEEPLGRSSGGWEVGRFIEFMAQHWQKGGSET